MPNAPPVMTAAKPPKKGRPMLLYQPASPQVTVRAPHVLYEMRLSLRMYPTQPIAVSSPTTMTTQMRARFHSAPRSLSGAHRVRDAIRAPQLVRSSDVNRVPCGGQLRVQRRPAAAVLRPG